jgi:hypothetical protein
MDTAAAYSASDSSARLASVNVEPTRPAGIAIWLSRIR